MSGAGGEAARAHRAAQLNALRRDLIVAAARTVFSRAGLEGASMRAIAAEAGCTTGAIYPLFAGKEALYAAVLAESLDALGAAVRAAMAGRTGAEAAGRGLAAFHDFYRARPDDLSLGLYLFGGLRSAGLNPELDADLNRRLRTVFDAIEGAFAAAGEEDPRSRTTTATAQSIGLLVLQQTGRLKRLERTADGLFGRFLEQGWPGLGASAPSVGAPAEHETTTGGDDDE